MGFDERQHAKRRAGGQTRNQRRSVQRGEQDPDGPPETEEKHAFRHKVACKRTDRGAQYGEGECSRSEWSKEDSTHPVYGRQGADDECGIESLGMQIDARAGSHAVNQVVEQVGDLWEDAPTGVIFTAGSKQSRQQVGSLIRQHDRMRSSDCTGIYRRIPNDCPRRHHRNGGNGVGPRQNIDFIKFHMGTDPVEHLMATYSVVPQLLKSHCC